MYIYIYIYITCFLHKHNKSQTKLDMVEDQFPFKPKKSTGTNNLGGIGIDFPWKIQNRNYTVQGNIKLHNTT